ncbi:outer membrane lipoprotein-sorting protein [Neptunicella marina]|uniref:outer membrane lipoprotein-sorting protein n=1 Tax=Neptunicella marina TaxID=2125989 RepID=UPI0019D66A04|nr:outer membrane lipoprotein-sorting protein [Neptunicella marina]
MLNLKRITASLLLVAALVISPLSLADDAAKGLEIAKERKARDAGWGSSESDTLMVLRDAQGNESVRAIRAKALEVKGDGDKSLTVFDQPADVKGTAFLSFSHIEDADEQWLYLPAIKRVKRISSNNKSGPFMSSEFAYEDMSSFELAKYKFNYLRDEKLNGLDCFVVEATPTDRFSGYTKIISWIDKQHYRVMKNEFYDRKKALLKTMTMSDYQLYLDKYWRPKRLDVINHQTGKSTSLIVKQINFNVDLDDNDFNKNSLKRVR